MVDWDDVGYAWSETAHALCERAGITNGNTIKSWAFHEDYGITKEELWEVLDSDLDFLYTQPIIPGTTAALNRIRNLGHRVHIVTARGFGPNGDAIRLYTHEQMIRENVPLDTLTFTKDKAAEGFFHYAVDDGVHNYEALNGVGTMVYLLTQPHNVNEPNVRRVKNLGEFADIITTVTAAVRGEK